MQRQIDCVVSAIGERTQYVLVDRGARGVAQRAAGRRSGATQEFDLPVDLLFSEGDGRAHFGRRVAVKVVGGIAYDPFALAELVEFGNRR